MTQTVQPAPDPAIARLSLALDGMPQRGIPPVERWNPPYCGEIDMRIAADGTWFHNGSPIQRPAMVKLFSSILRREPDGRIVLVTPVESVGIVVDDAPFVAVEMAAEGTGEARRLAFRTNVDDLVTVDADHGLRFEEGEDGGLRPYVHVRRGLWALLTRALTYDLLSLGEDRRVDGRPWFGIAGGGRFHAVAPSDGV